MNPSAFVSLAVASTGPQPYLSCGTRPLSLRSPPLSQRLATPRRRRRTRAAVVALDVDRPTQDVEIAVSESSSSASNASKEDLSQLRSEHLNAYFDADESMYQVRLANVGRLALQNFAVELGELQIGFRRLVGLDSPLRYTPPDCLNFVLSNEAVANKEREREFNEGTTETSWFVRKVYDITCSTLDLLYDGRPIQRFWFLETVARMPYFAYTSCLHLLSTLGWYRSPTLMNMHHAEELNEAYHLAVMESLGGDKRWIDRFLAFHASILYYWFLVFLFFVAPAEAYRFSEILESHAVDTYAEFIESNEDLLRSLPAPDVASEYFAEFLYYFDEFQLSAENMPKEHKRRPQIESLFDVFENILLDEREHTKTMGACIGFIVKGNPFFYNGKGVSGSSRRPNVMPSAKREVFWRKWSELNEEETSN